MVNDQLKVEFTATRVKAAKKQIEAKDNDSESPKKQNPNSKTWKKRPVLGVQLDPDLIVRGTMSDSPAEKAKIRLGDKIASVNGDDIDSVNQLLTILSDCSPGDTLNVVVIRDGAKKPLEILLAANPVPEKEKWNRK